jgi:hypothetical protein
MNKKDYIEHGRNRALGVSVEEAKTYMINNKYSTEALDMNLSELVSYLAKEYELFVSMPNERTVIVLGEVDAKIVGENIDPLSFLRGVFLGQEMERERARWDYDTRDWDL